MYIVTSCKKGFDVESKKLEKEAINFLGLSKNLRIKAYDLYDLQGASQEDLDKIKANIFDEKKYEILTSLPDFDEDTAFRFRQVTGQYNELEFMTQNLVDSILGLDHVKVYHSKVLAFEGLDKEGVDKFKAYYINPVENNEIPFDAGPAQIHKSPTDELEPIQGFVDMDKDDLEEFSKDYSMDLGDLLLCQAYFKEEGRNPNTSELQVIDTYWSDHCRHTTFNTELTSIGIDQGPYMALFQETLDDYMEKRKTLGRESKPVSLMDLGTIEAKYLRKKGILNNVEISPEINACALEIKVDVGGEEEDWILYFKNETHNHPTEIEPFGGASTCVGGGIRDPLSGRSWVYQAMRVAGAYDPTLPFEKTHEDKLAQRFICQKALEGNSDYGNQIGLTSAYAEEIYHPGYEAKRLETGALISAAPRENIVREEPAPGDKVILLGGRTGRDGIGAAVGSSQVQTEESLENAGAEVQKGAAAIERKIMRLFRQKEATRLIKRCNDFGAGGVSVAVGELTDGLEIDLDKVPVKYPGMHGGEIALAESQERMAVVVRDEDLEEFLSYAKREDVESAVIATVTGDKRMKMYWKGDLIIDLSREFLDSNGAQKFAQAQIVSPKDVFVNGLEDMKLNEENILSYVKDLNRASQKAMASQFDGSIGRSTVLFPYGGSRRASKEQGMVSKLPVKGGKTKTTSGMAFGFNPDLAVQSPFHGGYYAVIESVSRMVALGFDYKDIRLSFQEFFENLKEDDKRWGKPVAALLGANKAMAELELGSIGGKDSMSGTFEDIDVPPTLISFAVAQGNIDFLTSRAFKEEDSLVILIDSPLKDDKTLDLGLQRRIYEAVHSLAKAGKTKAISTVGFDGILLDLIEMSLGNEIGIKVEEDLLRDLTKPRLGAFIIEVDKDEDLDSYLGGLSYQVLGRTSREGLVLGETSYPILGLEKEGEKPLEGVYGSVELEKTLDLESSDKKFTHTNPVNEPRALVPVMLGTTGEYDLADSLEKEGFQVQTLVIKDSTNQGFEDSIKEFIRSLEETNLLALANGSVFGNEPNEGGRAWEIILEREDVKEAIHRHLDAKNLIVGLGSSFSALIRTGLIEEGRITGKSSIRVLPNEDGRFISDLYTARVVSAASAFTKDSLGQDYTAPLASSWGRLDLGQAKESLLENGQVLSTFTEYFSDMVVDALASPDGLVLGSISSIERVDGDLYKNVGEIKLPSFFKEARDYFNK